MAEKQIKSVEELKKVCDSVSEGYDKKNFLEQFIKHKEEVKEKLSIDEYIKIIKLNLISRELGYGVKSSDMSSISPSNEEREGFVKQLIKQKKDTGEKLSVDECVVINELGLKISAEMAFELFELSPDENLILEFKDIDNHCDDYSERRERLFLDKSKEDLKQFVFDKVKEDNETGLRFLSYLNWNCDCKDWGNKYQEATPLITMNEVLDQLDLNKENDLAKYLLRLLPTRSGKSYDAFLASFEYYYISDEYLNNFQLDKDQINKIFTNFSGDLSAHEIENLISWAKDASISKELIQKLLEHGLNEKTFNKKLFNDVSNYDKTRNKVGGKDIYRSWQPSLYEICSKCEDEVIDSEMAKTLFDMTDPKNKIVKGRVQNMERAFANDVKPDFNNWIKDQIFVLNDKELKKAETYADFERICKENFNCHDKVNSHNGNVFFKEYSSEEEIYCHDMVMDEETLVKLFSFAPDFDNNVNTDWAHRWWFTGDPKTPQSLYPYTIQNLKVCAKEIFDKLTKNKGKMTIEQLKILVMSGFIGNHFRKKNSETREECTKRRRDFLSLLPDKIDGEFMRWLCYAYCSLNYGEAYCGDRVLGLYTNVLSDEDANSIIDRFDGEIDQYTLSVFSMLIGYPNGYCNVSEERLGKLINKFKLSPGHQIKRGSLDVAFITSKFYGDTSKLEKLFPVDEDKDLNAKIETLTYENQKQKADLDEKDNKINNLNNEINDLKNKLTLEQNNTQNLNNDISSLKGQIKTLTDENVKQKEDLNAKDNQINDLETQLQSKKDEVQKLSDDLNNKNADAALKNRLNDLENQIKNLETEKTNLKTNSEKQLSDLKNQLKQLESEKNNAEKSSDSNAAARKQLEADKKNLEANKSDLENKINLLEKEINDLKTNLNADEKQVSNLKADLQTKDAEIQKLNGIIGAGINDENIKKQLDDLNDQNKKLQNELSELKTNKIEDEKKISDLENQLKTEKDKVQKLNNTLMNKNELEADKLQLETDKKNLLTEKQGLEDKIKSLEKEISDLENDLDTKNKNLNDLNESIKNQSGNEALKTLNDNLTNQVKDLETQLNNLKDKDNNPGDIAKIQNENESLLKEKQDLEDKIKDLEFENKKLSEEKNNGQQNNDSVLNSYIGLIENKQKSYDEKESQDRLKYIEQIKNDRNKQEKYKTFVYDTKVRFLKFVDDIKEAYENDKSLDLKNVINESCYFIEFLVEDKDQRAKFLAEVKEIKESGCTKTAKIKRFLFGLIKTILFVFYGKEGIRDIKNLEKSESYWSIKGKLDKLNKFNAKKTKIKKTGDKEKLL